MQMLPTISPTTVSLAPACIGVDTTSYHAGDCAVTIGGKPISAGAPPNMAALARYATGLSAVVAATTCSSVQNASKGLATAVSDIAANLGNNVAAAAAGPISTIASVAACAAIDAEQIRILRTATVAANPLVKAAVPLIADAYQQFYADAINDAFNRTTAALGDYQNAARSYRKSKSAADLASETASLTQAQALAAAIDKAKAAPQPGLVVANIATLHQTLTDDLQSPKINLKRVLADAQAVVTEAITAASAAQALDAALNPAAPARPKAAHSGATATN